VERSGKIVAVAALVNGLDEAKAMTIRMFARKAQSLMLVEKNW
jgi:hypothetical protein